MRKLLTKILKLLIARLKLDVTSDPMFFPADNVESTTVSSWLEEIRMVNPVLASRLAQATEEGKWFITVAFIDTKDGDQLVNYWMTSDYPGDMIPKHVRYLLETIKTQASMEAWIREGFRIE